MELLEALFNLRPEGWAVLLALMLPLSLFFVVHTARVRLDLRRERLYLHALALKTREVLMTEPDDRPEAEETVEDLRGAIGHAPQRSIVRRAFHAAEHARTLASPNLSAAVDAITVTNDTRLTPVRNVPNLLMLAGLLGTVLGLASSIAELGPQIAQAAQATEPTQLAAALGRTLGTMQGAFACSLWGIALSLSASLWLAGTARDAEHFADELNAFVHAELVPAIFPRAMEGQIERMVRFLKGAGETFRALHGNLEHVALTFDSVLTSAGATLSTSLDQLQATSAQVSEVFGGINQSVNTLSEKLKEGAQDLAAAQDIAARTLREAHTDLSGNLRKQSQQIQELQERFSHDTDRILTGVLDVNDALNRTTRTFAETAQVFQDEQRRHLDRVDSGFREVQQQLGQHVDDNRDALSAALTAMALRQAAGD